MSNSSCILSRSAFLKPHRSVLGLFLPTDLHRQFKPDDVMISSSVFSYSTLLIRPALLPKIRSRITSEQSLLTIACVQTAHRYWEIKPLLYILAFAGLKSLSRRLTCFQTSLFYKLVSFSIFLPIALFLHSLTKRIWLSFLLPGYISFKCLLPPHLLLSFSFSHHSSTRVNGRSIFFDKKPQQKVFIRTFLPLMTTSKSSNL